MAADAVVHRRVTTPRPTTVPCGWCGSSVRVPPRGRVPTWCGTACRHRAWEQKRAAASGLSAKEVVERVVERTVTVTVRVPSPPTKAAKRPELRPPSRADEWVYLLAELTKQVDTGRVYARDLAAVSSAVGSVQLAVARRRMQR